LLLTCHYRLDSTLKPYRHIFRGVDVYDQTKVVVKCQLGQDLPLFEGRAEIKETQIGEEWEVLQKLQGGIGMPRMLHHGWQEGLSFLVLEQLGESIEFLF